MEAVAKKQSVKWGESNAYIVPQETPALEDQAEREKPKDETEKERPLRWVGSQESKLSPSQRKTMFQEGERIALSYQ